MATSPAPRSRSRALRVDAPASTVQPVATAATAARVSPDMIALAQKAIVANALKNKGTREEKNHIEALNKLMIAKGVERFNFTVEPEAGKFLSYEAVISEGEKDVISVAALRGLVDDATFMKIVKAGKGDIETFAGKNVLVKVTATEKTPAALKLKQIKE